MMPVIISLFGNEDMDITEFPLTNKSVFYLCSYGECFRFIADKCMHCCANPIPDTEMHINYHQLSETSTRYQKGSHRLGSIN